MKTTAIEQSHNTIQKENPGANTMVAVHNADGDIAVSISGDFNKISQALYAAMHDTKNPKLANEIYLIIKNVVFNAVNLQSQFANDLINTIIEASNNNNKNAACPIYPIDLLDKI